MKRRILFTALVSLLLIASCNVNKTDDIDKDIHSIITLVDEIEKLEQIDNIASKREGWSIYTDELNGRWRENIIVKTQVVLTQGLPICKGDLYGDFDSVTIIRYSVTDKFGEVVKDGKEKKFVYKFNLRGDVVECNMYIDGLFFSKEFYKYDSQGNLIEVARYDCDGLLDYKRLYKYDSQGNMIEKACYKGNGSLDYKGLYKYDSQGNMIEVAKYYDGGSLDYKILYKYDSQYNMIEKACYKGIGSLNYKILYKYDSQDNMIETIEYGGEDSLVWKLLPKYDLQGNMIEVAIYHSSGTLDLKKLYKYDSQGNMIEKIRYEGEIMKPVSKTEQVIVYRK